MRLEAKWGLLSSPYIEVARARPVVEEMSVAKKMACYWDGRETLRTKVAMKEEIILRPGESSNLKRSPIYGTGRDISSNFVLFPLPNIQSLINIYPVMQA